jgi:hypothetical protein
MSIDAKGCSSILLPYKPRKLAVGEVDIMEAIPDKHMKTVAFLCVDEPSMGQANKRVPKATGFFVRVPLEGSKVLTLDYVITARHCIEEARQYGNIYIRGNRKIGGFIEFPTKVDDWYTSDDVDVAAIPLLHTALPPDTKPQDLDLVSIKIGAFIGGPPDYKSTVSSSYGEMEIQPRIGHQIYFIGLFTEHYGEERNLPIARFGHISRMPDWIDIETLGTHSRIVAYLVEFHSWGGHSGSPVFFLYPSVVQDEITLKGISRGILTGVHLRWTSGLMGLVSGHYDIKREAEKTGEYYGEVQFAMNSGIAIVTPAQAIKNLLVREDIVKERAEIRAQAEAKRPFPTLDTFEEKDARK